MSRLVAIQHNTPYSKLVYDIKVVGGIMAKTGKKVADLTWWEKHADAVTVGVILLGLGGIFSVIWPMNSTISAVSTKLNSVEGRVGRIADYLPELNIKIATEDVFRRYDFAVLQSSDMSSNTIVLIDIRDGKYQKWTFPANNDTGLMEAYSSAVSGAVMNNSAIMYSLANLQRASIDISERSMVPSNILAKASFVGKGRPDALASSFKAMNFVSETYFPLLSTAANNLKRKGNYPALISVIENEDVLKLN